MAIDALTGQIPDSWEVTSLGEVVQRAGGHIQTGPFGSQLHASDYVEVGIPSIMPINIGDGRIIADGIARVSVEDARRLSRHRVSAGDIVYSRRGDVERHALVQNEEAGWLCGTGCIKVNFGQGAVHPRYASYYLRHPATRAWISRHAVGATMPNLNTSIMSEVPFVLPPPEIQYRIADILGKLDDKIELNRRMNRTLEKMAAAIFKSWFIDFDPVHAKAEGRDPGLPAEIADLFPDSFEESELGPIPEGWRVTAVEEVAEIVKGRSYKSAELQPSDVALVTLKSFLRGGGYREDGLKPYTGKYKPEQVVRPGEIVVAMTDVTQNAEVIGRPAIVMPDARHGVLVASLDTSVVRPTSDTISTPFLYGLFSTEAFRAHTYAHSSGTTVLHLAKNAIPSFTFPCPTEQVQKAFLSFVGPLRSRQQTMHRQNRRLAGLRDALLPKLLSSEFSLFPTRDNGKGVYYDGKS